MDRLAVRREIEILFYAGHKSCDIKKILDSRHSSNAPSLRTVQKWIERVKCGDTELKDSPDLVDHAFSPATTISIE